MSGLFGTDGVRGIPGKSPLTPAEIRRLGAAAAKVLLELRRRSPHANGAAPFVMMGRDTRRSGPGIGRSLAQGFASAGCRVRDLGVIPTPGVSYLTQTRGAFCGIVISASHNPAEFNGIKFFTAGGFKLPVAWEKRIEEAFRVMPDPSRASLGRVLSADRAGRADYLAFLRSTFPPMSDLAGLRLVIDGSHGAASALAAGLLRDLGAKVFEIGCRPDGDNINKGCGALDTGWMRREVLRRRADAGIAFDGDADRALLSDEHGHILSGDHLLALSAVHLDRIGMLRGRTVVLTVMSNMGLVEFLGSQGIGVVRVPVGDRSVTDAIESGGYSLGGENSGHVVFRAFAPTGDGLLTALQTLAAFRASGRPLGRVRGLYREFPQVLKNVRISRRVCLDALPAFGRGVSRYEKRLKGRGRLFVRYSGTEPLLRILVEGSTKNEISLIADDLARIFIKDVNAKNAQGVSNER